jgi:phage FluMu protein Com
MSELKISETANASFVTCAHCGHLMQTVEFQKFKDKETVRCPSCFDTFEISISMPTPD